MSTFESDSYVSTEYMKPGESKAFVFIYNSAASISNPVTRLWSNRQSAASLLSGSASAASNVLTGQFFTAPAGSWGKTYIYEAQVNAEGQTLVHWLKIVINSLPRGA